MQTTIVDAFTIQNNTGSFFWPFVTTTMDNTFSSWWDPFTVTLKFLGLNPQMTENAIYINEYVLTNLNRSTVYHEYGHFIMKQKRGDWPVTLAEYGLGLAPFNHNPDVVQQNSSQAYIEGWANFYELAVIGWVANPSNPYSASKWYVNGENNKPVIGPDGYKHEYTVANAFFDFYDPANDETFQTSYANISNVIAEKQNLMSDFISALVHKSYITDVQRNAGIGLMNLSSNKMSPLTSYGNATMYVKNDFNGGIVNINNSDINTTSLGGAYSTTELWMSNLRTLKAKEQMFDNYQRLFKHTRPNNQTDTWTTGLQQKTNFTEIWDAYTDGLTFTANFDKGCNITYTQQGDGVVLSNTTNSYRSETPVSLSAPDMTQNGVTYKFVNWENGTTLNPRTVITTQHQTYTANYKAQLASSATSGLVNGGQRKILRTGDGSLHTVYESAGKIWYEKKVLGGAWTLVGSKDVVGGEAKSPSITSRENSVIIIYQKKDGSNSNIEVRMFDYQGTTMTPVILAVGIAPYTNDAQPVVASTPTGKILFAWKQSSTPETAGLYYSAGIISEIGEYEVGIDVDNAPSKGHILETNASSSSPSVTSSIDDDNPSTGDGHWYFPFVWTQGSSIYYRVMIYRVNDRWDLRPWTNISSNSGYTYNYSPSVISYKIAGGASNEFYSRIVWIGKRFEEEEGGMGKAQAAQGTWARRVVYNNQQTPNTFEVYGDNVTSVNINKNSTGIKDSTHAISWSTSTGVAKYRISTGAIGDFQNGTTIINGKDAQLSNGTSFSDMYGLMLDASTSAPYHLRLSDNNLSQFSKQQFSAVNNGREGIVRDSTAQFYFAVGDILVNGEPVNFEGNPDTIKNHTTETLNANLVSSPIELSNNSNLLYSVQYGITDSAFTAKVLAGGKTVNFKIQLVDANTNAIIGEYDNVTFSSEYIAQYNNVGYEITTAGIGNRVVRLRLVVNAYSGVQYALSNRYNTESIINLGKTASQRTKTGFKGSLEIKDYALSQNYPNPFNPTTRISYALPAAGPVSLKVYDVLGKEVMSLVNNHQESGRYDVEFDASRLSSGMYIYKLTSGTFSQVRKMMFVK